MKNMTKLTFESGEKKKLDLENQYELVETFVHQLERQYFTFGNSVTGTDGKNIVSYVKLYEKIEFPNPLFDNYTETDYQKIVENGISINAEYYFGDWKPIIDWKDSKWFLLSTNAFDEESPVICMERDGVIPVYQLKLNEKLNEALFFWQQEYKDTDRLWLSSSGLEIPTYRQLSEHDSELSEKGLELVEKIERETGIATFLFLNRYWGFWEGEEGRKCPKCDGSWVIEESDVISRQAYVDFICKNCRLASCKGKSFESKSKAYIGLGMYKRKKSEKS